MTLYNIDARQPSPSAAETLAVLSDAVGGRVLPSSRRVIASADSRAPGDGLALLAAYVAIEDRRIRQAILDTVLAIVDINPPS
jgi:hypothetical protein